MKEMDWWPWLSKRYLTKFCLNTQRPDVTFILLINAKISTIIGMLTFMSRTNIVLSWVEHELFLITFWVSFTKISRRQCVGVLLYQDYTPAYKSVIVMPVKTFEEQTTFHAQLSWEWRTFYDLETRPQGYKTFYMLNSAEHEFHPAHKC